MPWPSHCPTSASSSMRGLLPRDRGRGDARSGDSVRVATEHLHQAISHRRVGSRQLLRLANQCVAGGVLLPAASVPALAAVATGNADHVAPLPGHPVGATEQIAVDHQAAADARTQGDADHHRRATAGAEPVLRPRRSVGVVVDDQRQVDAFAQPVLERFLAPGEVRGEADDRLGVVDPAGGPDAGRLHAGMPAAEVGDEVDDRVLDGVRTVGRGRHLEPLADSSLGVDHTRRHLRTADVDADAEGPRRSRVVRLGSRHQGQPSTRRLSSLRAPSMIVFSALRRNIPIIGMLTSTDSV